VAGERGERSERGERGGRVNPRRRAGATKPTFVGEKHVGQADMLA